MYLSPFSVRGEGRKTSLTLIQAAIESTGKLLGRQKREEGAVYRLSKYCVRVPVENGTLYYHTLTGALWRLEPGEDREQRVRDALTDSWFLVPEGFQERKQTDDLRRVGAMLWAKQKRTHFTVLTTTDCNARCFYCYEMGAERFAMSDGTAHDTAEYMARVSGGEEIRLRWFGGEPLYNRHAIEIITSDLREKGVGFTSGMVSNGYYLDRETAEEAVRDWHLDKVQISLDGTNEVYRKAKAYIERDADPLTRVLGNIETAMQAGIAVNIRLNMDRRNADDLVRLADMLAERFPDSRKPNVYVSVLQEFAGPVHDFSAEEEEKEKALTLRRHLVSLGLHRAAALPRGLRVNRCMADQDFHEAILPDGRTVTCEHFNSADPIGHIRSAERDAAVLKAWKETILFPACEDCAFYPHCINLKKCPWTEGGCSATARAIKKEELEMSILAAYHTWKNETEKEREA